MTLILKSYDKRDQARDRQIIIATMDKYVKKVGQELFESRLDVMCLEIADRLGYVFERDKDELVFIQRGLE